jgi:hypothetical protein
MLFNKGDSRISKYNQDEIMKMVGNSFCHSPEQSEDEEDNDGKRRIVVYDYSWRSDEVCQLFSLYNIYV